MKINILYLKIIILIIFSHQLQAQNKLKLVNKGEVEIASLLSEKKIKEVHLTSDFERSLTITVHLNDHSDQAYQLKATVLNKTKKPNDNLKVQELEVDKNTNKVKLTFTLNQDDPSKLNFETRYVQIEISQNGSSGLDLDDLLGSLDIVSEKYIYKHQRLWPLTPPEIEEEVKPTIVKVSLIPFNSARNLKQ